MQVECFCLCVFWVCQQSHTEHDCSNAVGKDIDLDGVWCASTFTFDLGHDMGNSYRDVCPGHIFKSPWVDGRRHAGAGT